MNYITNLLTLQNQMRVFHWQTQKKVGSYAQHVAFGTAYDELGEKIDDFIEIYQGKKGVIMGNDGFNLKLSLSKKFNYVFFFWSCNGNWSPVYGDRMVGECQPETKIQRI